MGMLWDAVQPLGNPELVGLWPTDGYTFEESRGLYDENHFYGVGLDFENQSELTDDRIQAWVAQLIGELGLNA